MLFQKPTANTLQVGWYSKKSDGNWSYTWFSPTIPVDGNWHLVAVTLKNGIKSLYIDEALKQQVTGCGGLYPQVYDIYIGSLWRNFRGAIDEVCIYNRALTQEEVYRLWAGRRKEPLSLPGASAASSSTTYVWVRDLAGNANYSSAVPVQVKYDPTLPSLGTWTEAGAGKGKTGYTPLSPPEPPPGYTWTVDKFAQLYSATGNHLASPTVADTDGDGRRELLFGSRDGKLYVLWDNGSLKATYQTGGEVYSTPVVADLDLDGRSEIVFSSADGKIYCVRDNGTALVQVWAYNLGYFAQAAPTVADLVGDGKLELVFNTGFPWVTSATHKTIVVLDSNGSEVWSFSTPGNVYGSPAVFDVDGNGDLEVIFGCLDGKVYVLNGQDNNPISGWPQNLGSRIFVSTPVFKDTGGVKILACGWDKVACYNASGNKLWERTDIKYVQGDPAVADVNGDGVWEAFIPSRHENKVYGIRCDTGADLTGWPFIANNPVLSPVTLADLDADNRPEVMFGTDAAFVYGRPGENGALYILHDNGSYFKNDVNKGKFLTNGCVRSEPTIADLDWDGVPDLFFNGYMDNRIYYIKLHDPEVPLEPVGEVAVEQGSFLKLEVPAEVAPWDMVPPTIPELPQQAELGASQPPAKPPVEIPELPKPEQAKPLTSPKPAELPSRTFTLPPVLSWEPCEGAEAYEFELSTDPSFSSTVLSLRVSSPAVNLAQYTLEPGEYHWRVRSVRGGTSSSWSLGQSFTLKSPSAPPQPQPAPQPAPSSPVWIYLSALGILGGIGAGWFFYSRTRGGIYRKAERFRAERVKAELEELERRLREKVGKTKYEVLEDLNREIMRGRLMERAGETLPALPMEEEIKKLERLRRRLD